MTRTDSVAIIVASAFIMQQLDATIIATALPQIAVSFGVNAVSLNVAITSYVLAVAVFLPISGWLADRFGARTIFQMAIGFFTLGSLLCGLSHTPTELVIARIIQGAGGAAMTPVGRMIVLRTAEKSDYLRALAFMQVPVQIGAATGPLIGGMITTYASWRWIFLINLPIGALGLLLTRLFIDNFRSEESKPLDWGGFLLIGAALAALLYAAEEFAHHGPNPTVALTFVSSMILSMGAVIHSRRHPYPLMNLALLRLPTFRANFAAGSIFRLGTDGLPFLLPLLFQTVFGFSAFLSGALTFISALGSMAMRAYSRPIFRRFGFRAVLVGNAIVCAVPIFGYALFSADTPIFVMVAVLLIGGTVHAVQFVALNAISYAEIEPATMSAATTLAQLSQRFCAVFGVAFATIVLQLALWWRGGTTVATPDFAVAFTVAGLLCALSALFFASLDRRAGQEVSGHGG